MPANLIWGNFMFFVVLLLNLPWKIFSVLIWIEGGRNLERFIVLLCFVDRIKKREDKTREYLAGDQSLTKEAYLKSNPL